MPMHMTIPLLAAQGQDINPFCRDCLTHRLRRLVDHMLKSKVFLDGEIAGHLLSMLHRGDQDVAVKNRVFVEEDDHFLILLDDVIAM